MRSVREPANGQPNGHRFIAAVTAPVVMKPTHERWAYQPIEPPTGGDRPPAKATSQEKHDEDLERSVVWTGRMRRGFYVLVLTVALAGQVTGFAEVAHIPWPTTIPPVIALELGGVVVLANADVRRRLGERAAGSRALSFAIAAGSVAFNWLAHDNHLLGGFFAGMSALGYLVYLTHSENQRRDRLRAKGDLPPTTPTYELWAHWLRHPLLTVRAKSLAKRNPRLGLYGSIDAAVEQTRTERRDAAIAKVLHRKIRAAVDPTTADIAVNAYDLDEIAARVAKNARYDDLAALVSEGLTPERLGMAADPSAPSVDTPPAIEATPVGPDPSVPALPVGSYPSVDRRYPPSPWAVGPSVAPVGGAPAPVGPDPRRWPSAPPSVPVGHADRRPSVPPSVPPSVAGPTGDGDPSVDTTVAPPTPPSPPRRSTPVGGTRRSVPTGDGPPDGGPPSAAENAAELRRRYPDGLPTDWAIRQATNWSPGRVKNARAAYEAGADLNPTT